MANVEKVSVAIAREDLEWARAQAAKDGRSFSAVLGDAIRAWRRAQAQREVLAWLGEGEPPITSAERSALGRELRGRPARRPRSRKP